MLEEKGMIDKPNPTLKLAGFGYEDYIRSCKDEKELGKMIYIPRANKEWTFLNIEDKPDNTFLGFSSNTQPSPTESINSLNSMNSGDWVNKQDDGVLWNNAICINELKLNEGNNNNDGPIPTGHSLRDMEMTIKVAEKNKTCTAQYEKSDNTLQGKLHADSELMKMQLEKKVQEQEKVEKQKRERESMRDKEEKKRQMWQMEINRLNAVIKHAEHLSDSERQLLAEREKEIGNQCYRQKEYDDAIEYYTASIRIFPTPKAFNNRAACYLKQCKYAAALDDANKTLELDPYNIKALFRRGVALNHKNEFKRALDDIKAVLMKQPKHVLAQHMYRELREQINLLPKSIRVMNDDGFNNPKRVVELRPEEIIKIRLNRRCYEVNERNLPRVMCECSGSPKFLHSLQRKAHVVAPFQTPAPSMPSTSRILEAVDEPQLSKPPTKTERTGLEITEHNNDSFKPKKCAVVRDRTLLKPPCNNNDISDNQLSTQCTSTRESPPNSASTESAGYYTAEEEDIENVSN
ncbi:sperm-associated antigen 1-like isoform X2 [Homalodisca vitripennis]|uniref:sperm-associated antigen 1-like isoform X2 n=1 Tax=Homalodisca vitripennis TaxID=197043 RepID=UPI001EEC1717|nr:sperm-associated antigen 1-like isoform X2 [Homalodisca vitripennis]